MKTFYQSLCALLLCITFLSTKAQVPIFNSYPSAAPTIYLDFDGEVLEGTVWNSFGTLVCNSANLNTTQITTIFNRIAEDYRPFTVNVTTDSLKYNAAPHDKRIRLVLTTSSSWYGSAGGVAYINSFTWGDNTPCFVFTALLNYNTKNIAEAASHEVGHTLGLRHQSSYDAVCNKLSEYNSGIGSGEIGWAPIMGIGYYENMTLWNYGANPYGCSNFQDDLSIITGNDNGITYRTDDYPNTINSAPNIPFNNKITIDGIIEKPGDVDAVKFTIRTNSRIQIDAVPFAIDTANTGSNIDLELTLMNSAKNVIGVYNPATTLNASIDTVLAAGNYYLQVLGKGNIYAPNYASLGSYSIRAALLPATPLPLYKLQLKGGVQNKQHQLEWEIIADEKVVSQTIEAGTNSNSFQPIATVAGTDRKFTYQSALSGLSYYRLAVVFDNGARHYSNTIALRSNGANGKPYLIGNFVNGTLKASSPSVFSYAISDMAGRMVAKGSLGQGVNSIPLNFAGRGLYMIRFINGTELYTEKFNRQ